LDSVIEVTNIDVDVTANDVEIPTFRSTINVADPNNVDESITGSASD
jgi:hypothetical protein